jgi:hypothetical protein
MHGGSVGILRGAEVDCKFGAERMNRFSAVKGWATLGVDKVLFPTNLCDFSSGFW